MRSRCAVRRPVKVAAFYFALLLLIVLPAGFIQDPATIQVHADVPMGAFTPFGSHFGADEPDYILQPRRRMRECWIRQAIGRG
jgi:hypothetical protein